MLSSLLRKLSQDLLKVPTPPLSVIPIYQRDPSKVLEKLLETLGEERLKQHHVPISTQSIGTAQEDILNYAGHEEKSNREWTTIVRLRG